LYSYIYNLGHDFLPKRLVECRNGLALRRVDGESWDKRGGVACFVANTVQSVPPQSPGEYQHGGGFGHSYPTQREEEKNALKANLVRVRAKQALLNTKSKLERNPGFDFKTEAGHSKLGFHHSVLEKWPMRRPHVSFLGTISGPSRVAFTNVRELNYE